VTLEQFANQYATECLYEGIRPEVAWAQMCLETGFLKFGNLVSINQFNFAGLGATGVGNPGFNFAATYGDDAWGITTGIRAHIQHLKCYASTAPLNTSTCKPDGSPYDPRWSNSLRGTATTVEALGGKWASGAEYGQKIINYMQLIWACSAQGTVDDVIVLPSASASPSPSVSPVPDESASPLPSVSPTPGESVSPSPSVSPTPGESAPSDVSADAQTTGS
jgi:hypothetical protein